MGQVFQPTYTWCLLLASFQFAYSFLQLWHPKKHNYPAEVSLLTLKMALLLPVAHIYRASVNMSQNDVSLICIDIVI